MSKPLVSCHTILLHLGDCAATSAVGHLWSYSLTLTASELTMLWPTYWWEASPGSRNQDATFPPCESHTLAAGVTYYGSMGQDNKRTMFGLPWQEGDWCVQPSGFLWPKNAVLPPSVNWISAAHQSRPMIRFERKIWRCTWSVCRLAGRKTAPTPTLLLLAWTTE